MHPNHLIHREIMIEITKYKPIDKGTIFASFDIKIPKWGNFFIREILYFKKENQRWISFPSKQYEKEGEKKYYPYNGFDDGAMTKAFQDKVFDALDKYIVSMSKSEATVFKMEITQKEQFAQAEIPF